MRYAVLVSGGVDSSVALSLLVKQGYKPTAFYLKIWLEDELSYLAECPWQQDLEYVKAVCDQLDVPLEIISLQKEYWQQVVQHMLKQVAQGRTPNPDVLCNQHIKFGAFFDAIDLEQYDKIVTGHYASIAKIDDKHTLLSAKDPIKDQTYFLAMLNQEQLAKIEFPLGIYTKQEVRSLAQEFNLASKERKDSQGICFLGKINFSNFLEYHLGTSVGKFIEYETGIEVGTHQGFWFYTIGQRKSIGLSGGPWYVLKKDTLSNTIYISRHYYEEMHKRKEFFIRNPHWNAHSPGFEQNIEVKLRHGAYKHQCELVAQGDGLYKVILEQNDQGIAPGQYAVFYQNNICLGGGVIE